jgi:hypothetical protein
MTFAVGGEAVGGLEVETPLRVSGPLEKVKFVEVAAGAVAGVMDKLAVTEVLSVTLPFHRSDCTHWPGLGYSGVALDCHGVGLTSNAGVFG